MKDQTVCMTYFTIIGDINLDEVSSILGIKNTGGHSIGEKKKHGPGLYDWAAWQYGTGYIETLLADEQAEIVVAPLLSKVDELLLIKERYDCWFILMQVPKIENGNTPALGFKKDVIEFCAKTGTEIQIDLYANPYSSEFDSE
ncbi:MAG TPA: DUF4279 domain-containing protein [Pseudobacteroides sp.]|uniref:DUF4279 domain-containing protein n=1 Tax=Pseudobacteroides sp. TaxID=1968840 RepID=UPI002F935899